MAAFAMVFMPGCYYDNEEELYPDAGACDTSNVTYSGKVKPIIDQYCISCHSGGAPQGNVSLEGYANTAAAGQKPAGTYGSLYGVISHASGNSPMPKNQPKMQECKILQIKKWIDEGTKEN
ncbi:MAG: hypothetical protein KKA81_03350 [Bacteroidetes bacterium]|nr:hypothetical protein [Bacteroidota bacterium]